MRNRIIGASGALFALLTLAGCVSAPSTTPQEKPLGPEALGLDASASVQIPDEWWRTFGDSQLDGFVGKALKDNPSLAAALARVREAQSTLSETRASTYPQLSLDASETREHFSKSYLYPPPYAGTMRWIGDVQANLNWSLDLFGKQKSGIDRARASVRAASLDATAARLLLAGSVTEAYIGVARAQALTKMAQDAAREREGVASLTSGRVHAGLDTPAAEKQAEALLALSREDLVRTKTGEALAVHALAALTGRGAEAYNMAPPKLNYAALSLPQSLPADLLARRADIAAAEARIEAATAGRDVARKAFYPDVNLLGLAGWSAIGLAPLLNASSFQYGAGAAAHLPIFDAGELRAQYAGATAALDESVADYNSAVVDAVKQTADAITNLDSLERQASSQRDALAASRASFDLAARRYRSGLYPQQTVLDSESLLIQARRDDAALAADTAAARVALVMALGGGFARSGADDTRISLQEVSHEQH
ncbi:MAG TPA: efflux transporter outer membrane subunit [Rhizomicrobium sp.]|jgi:NodT family efflux transporter outer membrane factor (OMF) lipoprotein|nr:efflux transporter outer membrane subunit [Rhizomicrobium sp.]